MEWECPLQYQTLLKVCEGDLLGSTLTAYAWWRAAVPLGALVFPLPLQQQQMSTMQQTRRTQLPIGTAITRISTVPVRRRPAPKMSHVALQSSLAFSSLQSQVSAGGGDGEGRVTTTAATGCATALDRLDLTTRLCRLPR